jgi:hypothetical protein
MSKAILWYLLSNDSSNAKVTANMNAAAFLQHCPAVKQRQTNYLSWDPQLLSSLTSKRSRIDLGIGSRSIMRDYDPPKKSPKLVNPILDATHLVSTCQFGSRSRPRPQKSPAPEKKCPRFCRVFYLLSIPHFFLLSNFFHSFDFVPKENSPLFLHFLS